MKTFDLFIVELDKAINDTITTDSGLELYIDDNHYIVKYNQDHAVNNQAIAFKDQHTGVVEPLKGWSLLEPVEEEEVQESEIIEVVKLNETLPTRGRVAFTSSGIEEVGLEVGDVVGFKENRVYRIKINGKEYYRTRIEDLLYKEL